MDSFEKLGAFYLGRPCDPETMAPQEGYLLYDAKDLTTHAVCVGMTGSGKTGLCISLLEEAALDQVPAIIIDPKGDMSNLLLTFPDLKADDFLPWVQAADAQRKGQTVEAYAEGQASLWRQGLKDWGQDGERIRRLQQAAEFALYTPGSTAATPVSILKSFAAPAPAILADDELLREQAAGAAASLLGLLGLDADPVKSRDHILLTSILLHDWQQGQDLDLAGLIARIQTPPFSQMGILSLDTFYPAQDRLALALQFNNLLASPSFAGWLKGDPLDLDHLLFTATGKPRLAIFSIAHLSETERQFFVTLLLNQTISWMRRQSGSNSLRAILYMDEIYGYFPPVANPPAKAPLITLLKQARAYGLGVVLTTQNPVDLDYKGLSNTGTWFIGRLQTERDKIRVLEGLEGASAAQGQAFDRARMEQILSGLGNRIFLLHNVHDDEPQLFQTRWAMSYLCGPLTRPQLQRLAQTAVAAAGTQPLEVSGKAAAGASAGASVGPASPTESVITPPSATAPNRPGAPAPLLPLGIQQAYLPLRTRPASSDRLVYQPMLLAQSQVLYKIDQSGSVQSSDVTTLVPVQDSLVPVDWDQAETIDIPVTDLNQTPEAGLAFAHLPAAAAKPASYTAWTRDLKQWLYQTSELEILQCPALKLKAEPGESERDFRIRLTLAAHEARDAAIDQMRQKYAVKISSLEEKIRKAEQVVDREQQQARQQQMQTAISIGATLLSAFMGKKKVSTSSLGRATTAARGASRAMKEQGDISRTKESVEVYRQDLSDLQQAVETEVADLAARYDPDQLEITRTLVRPTKQNIQVQTLVLAWAPVIPDGQGGYERAYR
ncbi:MAG: ATP-binding protein [Clostridia bacterium]|nr:ATP-binding protein [Clostridia bacterium]